MPLFLPSKEKYSYYAFFLNTGNSSGAGPGHWNVVAEEGCGL